MAGLWHSLCHAVCQNREPTVDLNKADKVLRNLRPKQKAYAVPIGGGIECRVLTNGLRVLELRARRQGEKHPKRWRLGEYPALTISDAVMKASDYRAELAAGRDPEVAAQQRSADANMPGTVAEAAARFISEHAKVKNRAAWAAEVERLLDVELLPELGHYPLQQLRLADVTAVVQKKFRKSLKAEQKGVAANRLASAASKFFNWCRAQGWLAEGSKWTVPKPAPETERERVLTETEMGALWNALEEYAEGEGPIPAVHAVILQLLALTGARVSEVTALTVESIEIANGVMSITGGKTKSSNRALPLPPLGRAIVDRALVGKARGELLFPSPRAGSQIPSNEISRSARIVVAQLEHASWTPHDLRRTAISVMAEEGVDSEVRRRISGHLPKDIHGAVYDRSMRTEAMRAGLLTLERWIGAAAMKAGAMAGTRNVIQLTPASR